jgi:hypothetical protein
VVPLRPVKLPVRLVNVGLFVDDFNVGIVVAVVAVVAVVVVFDASCGGGIFRKPLSVILPFLVSI